jgi:hypothetical protein
VVLVATWLLAATNIQYALGFGLATLVATVLLMLWWLLASRLRLWDRLAGLVLFAAASRRQKA